jgi:hypothetical protein
LIAQITNSKEEDVKRLNKRLHWQLDHSIRKLKLVRLNINSLKLMIFIDASFANVNLHSQIDYVICLTDNVKVNIIHWFFTKCKKWSEVSWRSSYTRWHMNSMQIQSSSQSFNDSWIFSLYVTFSSSVRVRHT